MYKIIIGIIIGSIITGTCFSSNDNIKIIENKDNGIRAYGYY